jgi:hypothetical protein
MSAQGDVGRTSYTSLPFQSQVYNLCFNCSPDLEPVELFFDANPKSPFSDPVKMAQTRRDVAGKEKEGVVPMPVAFRAWGGSWGHISPLTPLDAKDCPPDMTLGCDWGDAYAWRWARSSAKTGAYGLILSDFSDSQPGFASNVHDFNPRIVANFVAAGTQYEAGLSDMSQIAERANWIVSNHFNAWNDFNATGYAKFYAALAARVGAATGRKPLIVDQCGLTPAARRLFGTDARILAKTMSAQNYVCMWDGHVIQADRTGPILTPPIQEVAGFVLAAAREPLMRNGANLEADDEAYWTAIAQFYPTLDPAAQQEVGQKLLKRLWIWSAWAHVADRSGDVRRAIAFASRDYWDSGKLTALDPMTSVLRTIVPARPFGPALYYSAAVERAVEQAAAKKVGTRDQDIATYLAAGDLQALIDGGAPVGYYVSDAALPSIGRNSAPSAWIVPDAKGLLPPVEQAALEMIAPVAMSADALAALPDQPLKLSKGLAGFGFYDTAGKLVLVISNPATAPDAQMVSGTVQLTKLQAADGPSQLQNPLTGATQPIMVSMHAATIPVEVARWDTIVLSLAQS